MAFTNPKDEARKQAGKPAKKSKPPAESTKAKNAIKRKRDEILRVSQHITEVMEEDIVAAASSGEMPEGMHARGTTAMALRVWDDVLAIVYDQLWAFRHGKTDVKIRGVQDLIPVRSFKDLKDCADIAKGPITIFAAAAAKQEDDRKDEARDALIKKLADRFDEGGWKTPFTKRETSTRTGFSRPIKESRDEAIVEEGSAVPPPPPDEDVN